MTERTIQAKLPSAPAVDQRFRRAVGQKLGDVFSETVLESTPEEFLKLLEQADQNADRLDR